MIIRSDCESLPKPTLSPCTRVPFSVSVLHCRRVVCACSAGADGSFSNKPLSPKKADFHPIRLQQMLQPAEYNLQHCLHVISRTRGAWDALVARSRAEP